MAITLVEGFDHVNTTALLGTKGWTIELNSQGTHSLVTGRLSGRASRHFCGGADNSYSSMRKSFTASTTVVVGFALRMDVLPGGSWGGIALLYDAGFTTLLATLAVNSSGLLSFRNSANTQLAVGTTVLATNTWHYIELKVVFNGASSSVRVRLNGADEIASTTVTLGSTAAGFLRFYFSYGTSPYSTFAWINRTIDIDDVYVLDTTGTDATDLLGDVHVETIYPSSDGANDQWTADTGTNSAARVSETSPDGDTSYIYSSVVNQKTTFNMGDLAILSGTVYAVQSNLYARKDDAATRQICSVVRQGGSDFDGSNKALGTSYDTKQQLYENDPSDSADWTISKVNSAEFGVKLTV